MIENVKMDELWFVKNLSGSSEWFSSSFLPLPRIAYQHSRKTLIWKRQATRLIHPQRRGQPQAERKIKEIFDKPMN